MRKLLLLFLLSLACLASAEESYVGIYMQGNKIGYASFSVRDEQLDGKTVKRNDSHTLMNLGLLGVAMTQTIDSTSWSDASGKPYRITYSILSGGRTQKIDARFAGSKVNVDIDNSGTKAKKVLDMPTGGTVVDDPLSDIALGGNKPGSTKHFFVLDPTTVSFIANDVTVQGPAKVDVHGKSVDATLVIITDPRAPTNVYVSAKGDLIKVEAPLGIEMLPETKEEALAGTTTGYRPSTDLAVSTNLKMDRPLADPAATTRLTVRISGRDLKSLPSDEHQTVSGKGNSWKIDVHPPKLHAGTSATIRAAAEEKPAWTKPGLDIPSSSPEFKKLARSIVGNRKTVRDGALAIKAYVYKTMRPNSGIGVVRDATEVLKTKEGVCRDYAILTATLMRSAGIPARLVSGLVNWEGSFYYHAWVEVWDGKRWLGIDSTTDQEQISAAHIKLAQGNVEDVFTFMLLSNVKVELLDARRG